MTQKLKIMSGMVLKLNKYFSVLKTEARTLLMIKGKMARGNTR